MPLYALDGVAPRIDPDIGWIAPTAEVVGSLRPPPCDVTSASSIGDNTLIGMGATVLNGARIGKNCLIGANALITEGKEIPDNSMVVGATGKVFRQIDEEGVQGLAASAERYIRNARRFAAGLTEIHPGDFDPA